MMRKKKVADRTPWLVVLPVSLATTLSLLGDSALYTVLPTHVEQAGVALAGVGVLLSANRFIRLVLNGPVGLAVDRWPRRRLFVPAVFLGAFSTALYALTSGFWPLLLGRLLWGAAWAGIWVAGNSIILDITRLHDRGRWVGVYNVSFFLGAAGGAILGGWLTDLLGYRPAMGVAAGLTLAGALTAWLVLPETSRWYEGRVEVPAVEEQPPLSPQKAVRPAGRGQVVSATALLTLNRLVVAGIFIATFSLFLEERFPEGIALNGRSLGLSTLTGLALGTSTLIGMFSGPLVGALSDYFGERWRVVALGLGVGIAGFGLVALGKPAALFFGVPFISLSSGSNQSLAIALVGDLSGRHRGRRLGVLFTFGDLGSAVGPPLAYALAPALGLSLIYALCAVLLGLMLVRALSLALAKQSI